MPIYIFLSRSQESSALTNLAYDHIHKINTTAEKIQQNTNLI